MSKLLSGTCLRDIILGGYSEYAIKYIEKLAHCVAKT